MNTNPPRLPNAISGDRPTGPLHLGHLVGSLENRLALQKTHTLTVLIADTQAQSDFGSAPLDLRENILKVMQDYCRVGLNPEKTRFVLQSQVPSLLSLSYLLLNFATLSQMERNPTIKAEITQKGFGRATPLSFLTYPVSQVSDMIGLGGGIIPVGEDQLPIIELGNDMITKLNRLGLEIALLTPQISQTPRLVGICGKQKMSKSLGNAIYLSDTPKIIQQKIMQMYTDEKHLRVEDKGSIVGNTVFEYLNVFEENKEYLNSLKSHYQKGGLGDVFLKKHLHALIQQKLDNLLPYKASPSQLRDCLMEGSRLAEIQASGILDQLRSRLFPL